MNRQWRGKLSQIAQRKRNREINREADPSLDTFPWAWREQETNSAELCTFNLHSPKHLHITHKFRAIAPTLLKQHNIYFPPILEIKETKHGQTEVSSKNLQTCILSPTHLTSLMIKSLGQEESSSVFQSHHVLDINKAIKPCSIDSYHKGNS